MVHGAKAMQAKMGVDLDGIWLLVFRLMKWIAIGVCGSSK